MDSYKEFKRTYQKYFLESSDFEVSDLITSAEDIPTEDDCYKNAVIRAYSFLSKCTNRDISHLKILTSYEKLFKKNRDCGMNVTMVEFATALYILHHYCVRVLRSPWRKDCFTIKAYNGFYQYTLRKTLSPAVIEEMLLLLDFVYDHVTNSFSFNMQSLNRSSIRTFTEAGIGFFLSYTHCMGKNDVRFKEKVMALTPLLYLPPKDEGKTAGLIPIELQNSPDRPGTSALDTTWNHSTNEHCVHSRAREKQRDIKRNIYGGGERTHISQPVSVTQSKTRGVDLYGPEDRPVDLSLKNGLPYGHTLHRNPRDRCPTFSSHGSAPGSDLMDDHALYGPGDDSKPSFAGNYLTAVGREPLLLQKPQNVRLGPHNLDVQMKKCGFQDKSLRTGESYRKPDHLNKRLETKDDNYVQFYQTAGRGSPDGEMTKEPQSDYFPTTQHNRPVYGKQPKRSLGSTHIYQEISDR